MDRKKIIYFIILFTAYVMLAQEQNITASLKLIESGNISEAKSNLDNLKVLHTEDPSVKFLEAVLTEDGELANSIYEDIYIHSPQSNYADASLYRIFSYYYARGIYGKAEELKSLLKNKYPSSPYIKAVDRTIPDDDESTYESAPTVPKAPVVPKTTSAVEYKFSIQAGAFLNNGNARKLSEKFQQDGYESSVFPKEIGGSIFNVVTVGQFRSREDADKFLAKLKSDYNLEGRIIPLN